MRKRFASIADPSQIVLVIIVDEGPVKIVMTGDPDRPTRVVRKRLPNMLVLPILSREDGYGFTYGARLTLPDPHWMGKRSRMTFPLTWGGTKQAGVDLEKRLDGGVIDRVTAGALDLAARRIWRSTRTTTARALFVRGEREFTRALRLGATTGWQRASFEGVADQFAQVGGDVVVRHARRSDPRAQRRLRPRVVGASAVSATGRCRRRRSPAATPAIRARRTARRSTAAAISGSSARRCSRDACCARIPIGRCRRTCSRSSAA